MNTSRFKDKVCIVTGGGSGIGRATSLRLASEGARVVIANRSEEHGAETVRLVEAAGGQAISVRCDVGVQQDIEACISATLRTWERIDVVVNNAAVMTFDPVINLEPADWENLMAVNLRAVFLFTKFALPHINGGVIVNISSVHAHQTTANVIPYAASKAAMEAFVRGCSQEYGREKARFVAVAPGAVDTPMLWENPNIKSGAEKVEGVIGTPEELAAAIAFVASDEASYINGTTLVVDGGRLAML